MKFNPTLVRTLLPMLLAAFALVLGVSPVIAQTESTSESPTDIIGTINPPEGVAAYNAQAGGEIGALLFLSAGIRLITIVAGVFVLINIVMAGYQYVSSAGDSSATQKAKDRITMSVIGLVIIVGAYTITALLSLVLFGDAGYILNPQITGPETVNPAQQLAPQVPGPFN